LHVHASGVLLGLTAILSVGASAVEAQAYPPAYEAPGGCPDEAELERTLSELLPEAPTAPPSLVVSVVPAESGFSLSILGEDGAPIRTFDGPDCAALVGSAAVHLALFYQSAADSIPEPVARPAPRPGPRIVPPPEPPIPLRLRAGLSGGVGGGALPGLGAAAGLELGVEIDFVTLLASSDIWPTRSLDIQGGGRGEFWRTSASIDGCGFATFAWFRMGACAGGGLVFVTGTGVDVMDPDRQLAILPSIRGRIRLELDTAVRPMLAFDLETLPLMTPFTLMDTGALVYETPPLSVVGWLGIAGVLDLTR
jgi:hypothetical protein